jgi:hypothetical protein
MVRCRFAKVKFAHILIAVVACCVAGCTSSYKFVLVSVVDTKTGKPVEGAKVSIHFHPHTKTTTGEDGMALLKLRSKDAQDAIFDVKVVNQKYDQYFGQSDDGAWIKRAEGVIPTSPDIVIEVESKIDQQQEEEAKEKEFNSAKRAAEQLNRESPDFWPERTNELTEILYSERWEHASKAVLGSTEDIDTIRSVVIGDMAEPHGSVDEIRWVSPKLVMVKAGWYASPMAAATYTYVVRKGNSGWIILTRAEDTIS